MQEMKTVTTKRIYLGSIYYIEMVETMTSGTEIWVCRDRDWSAFYRGSHETEIMEKSIEELMQWIDMEQVLDIVNRRLSYPGERWEIDGSGAIAEVLEKEFSV